MPLFIIQMYYLYIIKILNKRGIVLQKQNVTHLKDYFHYPDPITNPPIISSSEYKSHINHLLIYFKTASSGHLIMIMNFLAKIKQPV